MVTPDEQKILDDIRDKTGLMFRRVGGIRTDDPWIAEKVLPILESWYPRLSGANYRATIVHRFLDAPAHAYIEQVLQWWRQETDEVTRDLITQVVSRLARADNASRVWQAYLEVPEDGFSVFVLRKLAQFPQTRQPARDRAFRMLQEGPPGFGPLEIISRIADPRIRRWFRDRVNDPDPGIRKLAARLVKRGTPLPLQLERSTEGPDRFAELYSAEADLKEMVDCFNDVEARLTFKVPSWVRKAEFLDQIERDEWVFTDLPRKKAEPVRLWLRLEDLDAIEIVVTPKELEPEHKLN